MPSSEFFYFTIISHRNKHDNENDKFILVDIISVSINME